MVIELLRTRGAGNAASIVARIALEGVPRSAHFGTVSVRS
jgi:hypothetical protein